MTLAYHPRLSRTGVAWLTLVIALGGCGPRGQASASTAVTPAASLVVGLGYIPSVQFAPFYLADQRGYYRDAGLAVAFNTQTDVTTLALLGAGQIDVGLADGTSVIQARSQGVPVLYAATVYAKFPNVVIAKKDSGIDEPEDLAGKTIGTPGRFGSGWIMLQALLGSAGLTPEDVRIVEYPDFGQSAALAGGSVDAVTAFLNNEPVVLAAQGTATVTMAIDRAVPLPGNGIVVSADGLATKRPLLRAFVAATLHAMNDIVADVEVGVDAAILAVPELGTDRQLQTAILLATVEAWQSKETETHGLGAIQLTSWNESIEFMSRLPGMVPKPIKGEDVVTFDLLPAR